MVDEFESLQWHDNAIHGFRVIEAENGLGELELDIDFIQEWLPPVNDAFSFKISPATLVFHDVSDLVVAIDYAASTAAVQPMCIQEILREPISYPNGQLSFSWRVEIGWPSKSFISFQASGFTQTLWGKSVISGAQYLAASERIA